MINLWINAQRVFRSLTPHQMARTELLEAQLSLLESYSAMEHAMALVQYNEARVGRLTEYLKERQS